MGYQLSLFNTTRTIDNIKIVNYIIYDGENRFEFKNKNLIVGPNGSGKSTLINALYLAMGVSSITWNSLSLFTQDKLMKIVAECSTGYSERRKRYRDKSHSYYGLTSTDVNEVTLMELKEAIGLYEKQRHLMFMFSDKFIRDMTHAQRYEHLKKIEYLDPERLVSTANEYLKLNHHKFSLHIQGNKLEIKRRGAPEVPYSSGHGVIIKMAFILAAGEQLDNPLLVMDDDDLKHYLLDNENSIECIHMLDKYKGQIFIVDYDLSKAFSKAAVQCSFNVIRVEQRDRDYNTVSKKIKTRAYVSDRDMSLKSKVNLSREIYHEAIKNKKQPVISWSGGRDSTAALHIVLKENPNIPVLHVNTRIEHPKQYPYNRRMIKEWNLNTHITDLKGNIISTVLKPEVYFWKDIIDKKGFPLLPKEFRPCDYPYYRAAMEYCRIVVNTCCKLMKEDVVKKFYKQAGVDLAIRGLTGGESWIRKYNIVLNGYVRYVNEYETTIADIIGHFTQDDVIEYHKINNIPWAQLYDMGYDRNGCYPCFKSILFNPDNSRLMREENPKFWNYLMVEKGLAKEIIKLQYIIKRSKAKGLVAGQQLELDELDREYLDKIQGFDIGDVQAILELQPCKCDTCAV